PRHSLLVSMRAKFITAGGRRSCRNGRRADRPGEMEITNMRNVGAGKTGFVRRLLLCGSAAAAFCVPGIASAQDTPAETAAEDDSGSGNLILVTATKREKTLQDTPVAVSVTTSETIERAQIRDLRDLQTVVPSLSVGQRQSSANTNFFIRGFGNGAN